MKKIFFAAVFAGALLGFTSCGNREMVTDPEMETVIDSIKKTQSGQATEETTAGTEETSRVAVIPKTRSEVIPITIQQLQ